MKHNDQMQRHEDPETRGTGADEDTGDSVNDNREQAQVHGRTEEQRLTEEKHPDKIKTMENKEYTGSKQHQE